MENQPLFSDGVSTDLLLRSKFGDEFIFGAGSSSYQYEGAVNEGGKGRSIWDDFTQNTPSKIMGGTNGNVANDSYHRYKEDVAIIKKLGLNGYRISISWPRVLPTGRLSGGVNQQGVDYYNNVIDELLANGIEPYVTLFHWDLPKALEDEYGGFLNSQIVHDFCEYAEFCFWQFGDRVKQWVTFNESWSYSVLGYADGSLAPGRGGGATSTENSIRTLSAVHRCPIQITPTIISEGDPGREPYIVAHNQLLSHAHAVQLYRQKFQTSQNGKIGITLVTSWFVPLYKDNKNDQDAADRALAFMFGWFMDPLATGQYPSTMLELVDASRLKPFTAEESQLLINSFDFIGLNYYTANYATTAPEPDPNHPNYHTDSRVELLTQRDGENIGPNLGSSWIYLYPQGLFDLLTLILKEKYNNPSIYITENGIDQINDVTQTLSEARKDEDRTLYHQLHILAVQIAINAYQVNVKGYFAWSLMDNFEWSQGYYVRFGMIYIDYNGGALTRYPKNSAIWYMNFLKNVTPQSRKRPLPSASPIKPSKKR